MTDQEIQELAHYCANELYAHFGEQGCVNLMAGEYEDVIRLILKNHKIEKQ